MKYEIRKCCRPSKAITLTSSDGYKKWSENPLYPISPTKKSNKVKFLRSSYKTNLVL